MVYQVKNMKDLNDKMEEAGPKLIVLDFTAKWCGPCKEMLPKLDKYSKEFKDVIFLKVDVDKCDEVLTKYKIDGLPCFKLLKKRKTVASLTGADPSKLRALITRHR